MYLDDVPEDIIFTITEFLDIGDMFNLRLLNKKMGKMCRGK